MTEFALGIDLGTTAVKICLAETSNGLITSNGIYKSTLHNAYTSKDLTESVQDAAAIVKAFMRLLNDFSPIELKKVTTIGVCGQMHGIMWWNASKVLQWFLNNDSSSNTYPFSPLITWEDQRCSTEFLSSLPFSVKMHSGYGLASFAHLKNVTASIDLTEFDSCGTVQDFLVFLLCGFTSQDETTMDSTCASSWGGTVSSTTAGVHWEAPKVFESCGIDPQILPRIVPSGTIIGTLCKSVANLLHIPQSASIGVAMGDHPCGVLSLQSSEPCSKPLCFLNIGTSSQLALVLPTRRCSDIDRRNIEVRPHAQKGYSLVVAASLTGGNMISYFAERFMTSQRDLGINISWTKEDILERLIALGNKKADTDLIIVPTFQGERGESVKRGSVSNIGLENSSIGDYFAATCKGIVANIFSMLPSELKFDSVIATGNAIICNSLLQSYVKSAAADRNSLVTIKSEGSAAEGAIKAMLLNNKRSLII